jgi:hypothetical protein
VLPPESFAVIVIEPAVHPAIGDANPVTPSDDAAATVRELGPEPWKFTAPVELGS